MLLDITVLYSTTSKLNHEIALQSIDISHINFLNFSRYEIMLNCWRYLPKERPTFDELHKILLELQHDERPYVNLDTLMKPGVVKGGMQRTLMND